MGLCDCHFIHHGVTIVLFLLIHTLHTSWDYLIFPIIHHGIMWLSLHSSLGNHSSVPSYTYTSYIMVLPHFSHHGIMWLSLHSSWDNQSSVPSYTYTSYIMGLPHLFYHSSWDYLSVSAFIMGLCDCHFIHHGVTIVLFLPWVLKLAYWIRKWIHLYIHFRVILGLRPANERHRYKVTLSLISWAQT